MSLKGMITKVVGPTGLPNLSERKALTREELGVVNEIVNEHRFNLEMI